MPASPTRPWLRAGLELSGAATLLAIALAALTGSPAIEACAITLFVASLALYRMVPAAREKESPAATEVASCRVTSYVTATVALAFACGLNVSLAMRGAVTRSSDWPFIMEVGGLAILAATFAGWLYWNLRDLAGPDGIWTILPAGFLHSAPSRAAMLILCAAATATAITALLATLAAWLLQWPELEKAGAFAIALINGTAALFALKCLQDALGPHLADPAQLKTLTATLGAAAQKSGAIRQVIDIQLKPATHGSVIGTVQLQFKDGTSATHVAPVLASLHKAAADTIPGLTALVLVPPPKD